MTHNKMWMMQTIRTHKTKLKKKKKEKQKAILKHPLICGLDCHGLKSLNLVQDQDKNM